MTRSLVSRAFRTLAVASLVLTAASCGGSDETRQRNSALPDTTAVFGGNILNLDVTWVPEEGAVTLNAPVDKIQVQLLDSSGTVQKTMFRTAANEGGGQPTAIRDLNNVLDASITTLIVTAQFLNPDGSPFSETIVEFERAVGATRSTTIETPAAGGTTDSVPTDSVPEVDPATDTVLRMPRGAVDIKQVIPMPGSIADEDMFEISAVVKMAPGASDEATFRVTANLVNDQGVILEQISEGLSSAEGGQDRSKFSTVNTRFGKPLLDRLEGVTAIHFLLLSDAKSDEPGYRSAVITSASLKYNDTELLTNPAFEQGEEGWISNVSPWVSCATGDGISPCTGTDADVPGNNPGPTDSVPVDTTPTETTPPSDSDANDDDRAQRISQQEVECSAEFVAETRTITLCESFDQIVVAGFEADGNFADTVKGEGNSIVLPEKFIGATRVSMLRIAVASIPEGLDVPVFRGEGLVQIGDGSSNVTAGISISPGGTEAVNNNGEILEMRVQITGAGLFDIDWTDETKFAFVTLNGTKYEYYENVKPPAGWDEGKPLYWRAYAMDGFGMPRLVANGAATYDTDYEVTFFDPFFELWAQSVQVLGGSENQGDPVAGDPCFNEPPYLITDPVTPSGSNRVTLVVDRDCQNPDGGLGLMVFSEDEYYDWDWGMPLFARMVSTKYNSRLEATLYLASGAYVFLWGDAMRPTGEHAYRVTGEGSKVSCIYPSLNVDVASKTGTLENCRTGNRRVRVYAYPAVNSGFDWDNETRVPYKDGKVDLSALPFSGPMNLDISIDDAPDGEALVCFENCEAMTDPTVFTANLTVDTTGFDGTGKVTSSFDCATEDLWSGVAYFRRTTETSWTWVQWMREGQASLPFTGEYYAMSDCWDQETQTSIPGAVKFTAEGSMPNRPSNDSITAAAEITPDIGSVRFTTVSATSQRGEAGPVSSGVPAEEFRSVWFKRTIAEGETSVRFALRDVNYWSVIRIYRITRDGALGLQQEWWWSYWDDFFSTNFGDGPRYFETDAPVGTTFYVQVLGDWVFDAGEGVLVVNGGEGAEAAVPPGDQPYTPENNTQEFTIEAPTNTVPTDTSAPSTDTSAPSTDTSAPSTDTSAPSTDTSAPSTDTSAPVTDSSTATTDSTAPGSPDTLQARYDTGLKAAANTEVATVLVSDGSGPAFVDARKDAAEVEIPVIELYATVSKTGADVDAARPLVVRAPGQRAKVVRPTDRTVTVPVGADTTDISITAVDSAGKQVTAPLQVKKTQPPLVKVNGSGESGSSFPWLWIALGAVVVLAGGAFAMRGRRTTTPSQE